MLFEREAQEGPGLCPSQVQNEGKVKRQRHSDLEGHSQKGSRRSERAIKITQFNSSLVVDH
jgi:hypothetical protein